MHIVKDGEIIAEDIYDGRNSEWFRNLQRNGNSDLYDSLPLGYGIPKECPKSIEEDYSTNDYYYGFHYIKVQDYINWYRTQSPELEAGWVSRYDAWQLSIGREIIPDEYYHRLPEDCNENDWIFMSWTNPYCQDTWLFEYLCDNKIATDAYLIYYFDN